MSEVPVSLNDIKIEIGKNILRAGLEELGSLFGKTRDSEEVVARAPDAHHIDAANTLRAGHPDLMRHVAWIAQRARYCYPDRPDSAYASVMADEIKVIRPLPPEQRYKYVDVFVPIFRQVFEAPPEQATQCLEALVGFCGGK